MDARFSVARRSRADELLEHMRADIENGLVPAEVFNDPSIHQIKLRQVLGRCCVYIRHQTEIPNPGDYHVRGID
ncbi:hypothetical protein [Pseudonocardia sp. WMMC193]|uniref:hypothetical protein n=1 Tax=Pseudonocardia sp. WMMC193 TaxID=2911965 RepID=UPI001F2DD4F3|nr:hypothetical protein [Pseudonocardia sp. WMMC193]MCF7552243.1 hypothetical protein [Pseudonocardia sp. WMMC193]